MSRFDNPKQIRTRYREILMIEAQLSEIET